MRARQHQQTFRQGKEEGRGKGRTEPDPALGRTDPDTGPPDTGTFGGTWMPVEVAPGGGGGVAAAALELSSGVGPRPETGVAIVERVSSGGGSSAALVERTAVVVGSASREDEDVGRGSGDETGRGAEVVAGGRTDADESVTVTRTVVVAVTVVAAPASGASVAGPTGCARATPSCERGCWALASGEIDEAEGGSAFGFTVASGSSPRERRCALRLRGLCKKWEGVSAARSAMQTSKYPP